MESADSNRETASLGRWPNRRRKRRLLALGAFSVGLLAFSLLVWPTPYRYGKDSDRHRVNRLTGNAEVYDKREEEWKPARRGNGRGYGSENDRGSSEGTASAGSGGGSPIGGSRSGGGGGGNAGGGSPIGGSRSGGGGDAGGNRWWYEESGSGSRDGKARGDQWWYKDRNETSRNPKGSPVGGSREPAEKGSPIGGQ